MISGIAAVALAMITTVLSAVIALLAYGHHRRQAIRFWQREQRLPDATRYENLGFLVEQLQEEHAQLRDQIHDARDLIEEADRRRTWMEETKSEIESLEQEKQEVIRVQNELETKQVQLAELQETQSKVEGELKQTQERLDSLANEERRLQQVVADLHEQEKKANAIREEIQSLDDRKQKAEQETEEIEKNARRIREELESELRNLKRECQEAEQQRESQIKKLDDFEKRLAELSKQESELKKDRRNLQNEVERLEGQRSSLAGQIPTLQDAFTQLSSSIDRQSDGPQLAESELWQPVLSAGSNTSAQAHEDDSLLDLQGTLRSLGLRFDQRTIYAFHTALKSTSSSPLITLAGVSGTGKSELPRRYADTMGINFLNVAVQPRWDSPQDLFGFYDYLEQRFRPTEMTRALLQMDPIGPETGRGWTIPEGYEKARLHDQMLLILLDEMNLARVEYYFSEFLSKLETRRGVDPGNELRRKRAEIVLEVSGRTSKAQPLRLFVDSNVLFVGTMNEDESTQALSDKVIDRSNLLRFGSPNTIDPIASHHRNGRQVEHRPRLQREDWQSWCRSIDDLGDGDQQRLLSWIGKLRDALDGIGRPFAYRVANAMLEYAANYPLVENRIEHAMADQIEQRILPKLIGMDMHQSGSEHAVKAIVGVLDEINDDELKDRIDSSRREDYFQWTGLDRTAV